MASRVLLLLPLAIIMPAQSVSTPISDILKHTTQSSPLPSNDYMGGGIANKPRRRSRNRHTASSRGPSSTSPVSSSIRRFKLMALRGGDIPEHMHQLKPVITEVQFPGRVMNTLDLYGIPRPEPIVLPDGTTYINPGWNKTIVKRGRGLPPQQGERVQIYLAVFGKDGDLTKKTWTTKKENGKHMDYEFYSQMPGNQVIRGLDCAVATMKMGEVARVCVEPFMGYGPKGHSMWGILPEQPLIMRVELVDIYGRIDEEESRREQIAKLKRRKRRRLLGIPPPEQKVFKPWYVKMRE